MKELYKALATFQQEVPHIYKGTSGYGYKYADWGQILDVINPLMKENGLGFTQAVEGDALQTIVYHVESGESIKSTANIPQGVQLKGMNDFQVLGSAITYLRRYALSSILGLVTDEDKDASGEQVKAPKVTRDRTAEVEAGSEPFGESADTVLVRAKKAINEQLEAQDYTRPDSKKAFIKGVLGKETIDNLNDCDAVADALDNEK